MGNLASSCSGEGREAQKCEDMRLGGAQGQLLAPARNKGLSLKDAPTSAMDAFRSPNRLLPPKEGTPMAEGMVQLQSMKVREER